MLPINHLPALKDNIHIILDGSSTEKEKIKGRFFYVADTPEFMKELGLTGEYFNIRYGVITRHKKKDENHSLSEQNWLDLCKRVADPFAIIMCGKNRFRLFTDVLINNRNIVICVDVKNISRNLDVNYISTVFGYRNRPIPGKILFKSKKLTPEQAALLDEPNALSLPPNQGSGC